MSHDTRNWSWARWRIWATYQSGSAASGTTRSTVHTGSVEITTGASTNTSSNISLGMILGSWAMVTPFTVLALGPAR